MCFEGVVQAGTWQMEIGKRGSLGETQRLRACRQAHVSNGRRTSPMAPSSKHMCAPQSDYRGRSVEMLVRGAHLRFCSASWFLVHSCPGGADMHTRYSSMSCIRDVAAGFSDRSAP